MAILDHRLILDFALTEQWNALLTYLRGQLAERCPRYRPDEIELELGWVGSLAISHAQLSRRITDQPLKADRRGIMGMPWEPISREEMERELARQIHAHLFGDNSVFVIYERHCQAWFSPTPAEPGNRPGFNAAHEKEERLPTTGEIEDALRFGKQWGE